ncbi:MAG: phosphoribosyltransferase family protein [Nautiliaceae bacterium]
MNKRFYSYNEFLKDLDILEEDIKAFNPSSFVAIARGGMSIAHFLAEKLDIRDVFVINSTSYENNQKLFSPKISNIPNLNGQQRVLIIDDISDSGETLKEVLEILKKTYPKIEFKTLTLFFKENSKLIPDIKLHKTNEWVVFFWDKEGQRRIDDLSSNK